MLTVGLKCQIHAGKEKIFERKCHRLLRSVQDSPGHFCTQLYRSPFQKHTYLIISQWETREAFNTFVTSDQFHTASIWATATILAAQPRHIVCGEAGAVPASSGAFQTSLELMEIRNGLASPAQN